MNTLRRSGTCRACRESLEVVGRPEEVAEVMTEWESDHDHTAWEWVRAWFRRPLMCFPTDRMRQTMEER